MLQPEILHKLYKTVERDNILPITSACNFKCIFCSHKYNPEGIKSIIIPPLSLELIEDLTEYLDKKKDIVIGESTSLIIEGEPFTHKDFFSILKLIRKKCKTSKIIITTNGTYLNKKNVEQLSDFYPLEINLSLNVKDQIERKRILNDNNPSVALNAPSLLKKYEIPFNGSMVAMPHIYGWKNFEDSIIFLIENGARTIRIFIAGYSYLADKNLIIDDFMIEEIKDRIKNLNSDNCPITLEPLIPCNLSSYIHGVIKNSPAFFSGFHKNDVIKSINGILPISREHSHFLINQTGNHEVIIKRDDSNQKLSIDVDKSGSGLVFEFDINHKELISIDEFIASKNESEFLILTSKFAYNILKEYFKNRENLWIIMVPNRFFGGNIGAAGLLTCGDLEFAINSFLSNNHNTPDFILIPPIMLDETGRDITGTGIWELEEKLNTKFIVLY